VSQPPVAVSAAKAPIGWYGGKAHLAARIANMLPIHHTYVEAFGGAGSVLFAKPRVTLEVYNDIDSGLVTFFRCLRDQPEQLARLLRLTPYAREEFIHCRDGWERVESDLERARQWYVRMRQAFGCSVSKSWGHERNGALSGGTRAASFATTVDELERFAERFRRVQIEHLHWRDLLAQYDAPGVCVYLDPPYHPETRSRLGRNHGYRFELTAEDHQELIAAVLSLRSSVLLSGYEHPSYRVLEQHGFTRTAIPHHVRTARVGRRATVELVWRRVPAEHDRIPTLFDHAA
jgi:DNA adenine methylase